MKMFIKTHTGTDQVQTGIGSYWVLVLSLRKCGWFLQSVYCHRYPFIGLGLNDTPARSHYYVNYVCNSLPEIEHDMNIFCKDNTKTNVIMKLTGAK